MAKKIDNTTVLISAFYLILLGGIGSYLIVNFSYPYLWQRWLFFGCLILLGTGIALPMVTFINKVVSSRHIALSDIVLRESIGVGVYMGFLLWLAIGKLFTLPLAIAFGLILLVIEYLLRFRQFNSEFEEDV